jgi:DNA-binding CsgD family transcriptional regulator/tetratricopeptide (TPR) repeat protein
MRVTSSRFIGRQPELAELESGLAEAAEGRPTLALLGGESGVGKTRLLNELADRARESGARVIGGESVELGQDELPYGPLVTALRPLVRDADPAFEELPDPLRAELARLVPELGAPPSAGPDREAQQRLFEALLSLLERLAAEAPVLLWFDDVHWADASTRHFLAFLATSLCNERVAVVIAYRTDEIHRRHPLLPLLGTLERGPDVRRVELARFDREELGDQLSDILGEAPEAGVIDRLFERSAGNPLFTEELLAVGMDGGGSLPATLRDTLLLRLEQLGDAATRALRVLAVAGRADDQLLEQACGLEAPDLADGLREAVDANIVSIREDERYEYRHALLREAVYDDLLPGERSKLHQVIAEALERRLDEGDSGVWIATGIAHHFHAAGDQPKALAAAVRAADRAHRVHAFREAAALYERALELWDRVDDPEQLAGTDHAALLDLAGRLHSDAGTDQRAISLFERALAELDADREPERIASTLGELADAHWSLGQAETAREELKRALELQPAEPPSEERARLLRHHIRFLLLQGRHEELIEAAPEALEAADAIGSFGLRVGTLHRLGSALYAIGQEEEGERVFQEALDIAHHEDPPVPGIYVNWGDAMHLAGHSAKALELVKTGQAAAIPGYWAPRWLAMLHAEIAFTLGDWEDARREVPSRASVHGGTSLVNANLRYAEVHLGEGDVEAAAELIVESREIMQNAVEPQFLAVVGELGAEAERRQGNIREAREIVDWAMDRLQYCSQDATRMARLASAAVSVEADAAERARDLGNADAESLAVGRAELHAATAEAAAEEAPRFQALAFAANAKAELGRAQGADFAADAAAAARAWEELEWPYPQAIALWRKAQAEVAAGDRDAAAGSAAEALMLARQLGSAWLAEEVSGLAARARLRLQDAADADGEREEVPEDPFGLTPRERQVLALVTSGATNREIAAQLYMAEKTASVHVSRILTKLDVRSRTEAAAVAARHGLAEVPEPAEDRL